MLGTALLVATLAAGGQATATGERTCAERGEPAASDAAQVTAPLRFFAAGAERIPAESLRRRRGGWPVQKLPVDVAAGAVVTLSVAPQSRARLALSYVQREGRPGRAYPRLSDGQRAVTFLACPADTPMFSGPGVVGPRTGFPGGVIAAGAQCAHFRVRVRGERHLRRLRVGIGRRC